MVHSCSSINCTARWTKGTNIKFHRIPIKDTDARNAWLHALRRANYDPKYGFVCSKHFEESDYETNVHGNKVLRKEAIPSLFDFPNHFKKVIKKRRVLRRKEFIQRPIQESDNAVQMEVSGDKPDARPLIEPDSTNKQVDVLPSTSKASSTHSSLRRREPVCFGDFTESDLKDEIKRKRFWKVSQQTVSKYRKINKYYECKTRRLEAKMKHMNTLLQELKNQEKISSTQLLVLQGGILETKTNIV